MFQAKNMQKSLNAINEKGFVEVNDFFSQEILDKVNEAIEIPLNRPSINGSKGYVKKNNIRFLFGTLTWAREIIDIYTDTEIVGRSIGHC